MQTQFLDLGRHPIANGFLTKEQLESNEEEFFFDMKVGFDDETKLVSLMEFVDPPLMFNDSYMYHSSGSQTMRDHFASVAKEIESNPYRRILEIGSNDGVFLKHFDTNKAISVEPCGNFAEMTREMGYDTFNVFWNMESAKKIKDLHFVDLVYSANCMCHIPDIQEAFHAVRHVLDDTNGVFIFEDPCVVDMLIRNSYDQIYDEHAHLFSLTSLNNLLNNAGMEIFDVQRTSVHGGSNRVFAKTKDNSHVEVDPCVEASLREEQSMGIDNLETYQSFARNVQSSRDELVEMLTAIKKNGSKIVSYGATSKSTCIFNYCNIGPEIIDYIVDNTEVKQNKFSPGMHIPILDPSHFDDSVDYAFRGAWNFTQEIFAKEVDFLNRGGKFITHIPSPKIIRQKSSRLYKGMYDSFDQVVSIKTEQPEIRQKEEDVCIDLPHFKKKYHGLISSIEEGQHKRYSIIVEEKDEVSSLLDALYEDVDYTFDLQESDVVYIKSKVQYEKEPSKILKDITESSAKEIIIEDMTCTDTKTCASLENFDNKKFRPFWFMNPDDIDSFLEGYSMVSRIPYDFIQDMDNTTIFTTTETMRYQNDKLVSH